MWLHEHTKACKSACDFILLNLIQQGTSEVVQAAWRLMVWYKGSYISIETLLEKIQSRVHATVFEQYNYFLFLEVKRTCNELPEYAASALLVASGYDEANEDELHRSSIEAVAEAQSYVYGSAKSA